MPRLSTAEATVESLLLHGLDTVYALPGLHQDPLFDAFYHASDRLRVIHPRHEQTAAYMALGAALATGRPQAFGVVPGPGLLNAGAALLTAYECTAAGGRPPQGIRAECAGARLGPARRRAQPVGSDHDAESARQLSHLAGSPAPG